jgi:hypothetical protein
MDDDNNDDDAEEQSEYDSRRNEMERSRWEEQTLNPLQQVLQDHWTTQVPYLRETSDESKPTVTTTTTTETASTNPDTTKINPGQDMNYLLDYRSFFAPPFSPKYSCRLPFSRHSFSSQLMTTTDWDTYVTGTTHLENNRWNETVLFDQHLRTILEACDSVQGITIATKGNGGIYAGLTTALLQELTEECRTAGRWVLNDYMIPSISALKPSEGSNPSSQSFICSNVRMAIESGLALYDFAQLSHAILPLSTTTTMDAKTPSLDTEEAYRHWKRTCDISMALETTTLAYRANSAWMSNSRTYDDYNQGTRISFREFLSSLQPSERYKLLELDLHYNPHHPLSLDTGTSVERRRLQQSRTSQHSTSSTLPGEWLESSSTFTNLSSKPDVPQYAMQRSLHHHWSLASTMRCTTKSSDDMTCMLESMGIRYRPESYLAVILDQSFSQLISNGYAAGAYWKAYAETPLMSVLSNSTRSYFYVQSVANEMKEKLFASKYQGYRQREVTNGNLLETDDCLDAMEYCLSLQDTYRPPDGSGLAEDQSDIDWDVFG